MIEAKERLEWRCCFPFWAHVRVCWGAGLADLLLLLLLLLASLVTSSSFFFFLPRPFHSIPPLSVILFCLFFHYHWIALFFFLFVCLALFSSRRLSCYIAGFHGLTLPHVGCSVFFFFSCFPVVSVCVWKKKKITTTRDKLAAPSSFFFFFPPPSAVWCFNVLPKQPEDSERGKKNVSSITCAFCLFFFFSSNSIKPAALSLGDRLNTYIDFTVKLGNSIRSSRC